MGLREDLLRKIEKKQIELSEAERAWERQKAGAEAYVQALQETLKVLPRDSAEVKPEHILRAGGALARVRDFILAHRKPQHVTDVLEALGKPNDKKSRASLTSALGAYVRRREIFVRTAPNTFGLVELGHAQAMEEPPSGFGRTPEKRANEQDDPEEVVVPDDEEVPV